MSRNSSGSLTTGGALGMTPNVGRFVRQTSTSVRDMVHRYAGPFRDAIKQARSRVTMTQVDEYARNVAKKTLPADPRSEALEYVVALVVDLAQRGTLEDAESVGHHLTAIARAEYGSRHPVGVQLSEEEAHLAEELAEGEVEVAETAMARNPGSISHKLAYLVAAAKHTAARRVLDESVRRVAVTA